MKSSNSKPLVEDIYISIFDKVYNISIFDNQRGIGFIFYNKQR